MKSSKLTRALTGIAVAGGICAVFPSVYGQGIGVRELESELTPTDAKVARGKVVYQRNCVTCHGKTGKGDGPLASDFTPPPPDLTQAQYRYGGGPISIYYVVSRGAHDHPQFPHLAYQDRWAVTQYVRSLGPTESLTDPPALVKQAYYEAENGVCDPDVKTTIADKMQFKGPKQLAHGEELYEKNCTSCHGEKGKGDGPAAAALNPHPRNYTDPNAKWTNGTSPLAIFGTLTRGVAGTGMASYAQLPEEDRWALVQFLRHTFIPKSKLEESTEKDVMNVCRAISQPPQPEAIPVEDAMRFIVEDAPDRREVRYKQFGPVYLSQGADARQGEATYGEYCMSCHGPKGVGVKHLGPYGSFPPYLFVHVQRLIPAQAGGTVEEFAARSMDGAHATLPTMTPATQLTRREWENLQAYVAGFEGAGTVKSITERPVPEQPPIEEPIEGQPTAPAEDGATPADDGGKTTGEATEPKKAPVADEAAAKKPSDASGNGAADDAPSKDAPADQKAPDRGSDSP